MYIECDFLISKYKITLDELTCHKNQSVIAKTSYCQFKKKTNYKVSLYTFRIAFAIVQMQHLPYYQT